MKVRVRDIAKKAGVSPATVSNAINGRPGVSQENARQILRLAKEMGYNVAKAGRNATDEKRFVRLVLFKRHGLVVMDTQFFMEVIESIERECQSEGLELLITNIHAGQDPDYQDRVRSLCAEECAGILLMATEMYPEDLKLFRKCVSPLVALDNLFRHESVHAVVMNNYEAGYLATNALHDAGHRAIAHITSNVEFSNMRYRRKGYEAAMQGNALPFDEECFWRVIPTLEGAYEDMKSLLRQGKSLPTAFFAGNDIMAVGCMRALQERGIDIPGRVSVIGMDDMALCQISMPQLSTVRVFRREMGVTALRTLLHIGQGLAPCVIKSELSVELVMRQSVRGLTDSDSREVKE